MSGKLVDANTGEPVAFATVYLDGTSNGQVTDDDGTFRLGNVALPATLVVSHLNYQTLNVDLDQGGDLGVLKLTPQGEELTRIEVTDQNGRQKNIDEFRRNLLGTDRWGELSDIANTEALRFNRTYGEKKLRVLNEYIRQRLIERDRPDGKFSLDGKTYTFQEAIDLQATGRDALRIDLPPLGYKLRMDLNNFVLNYTNGRMTYLGTFFFTSVDKPGKRQLKNRRTAYYGSSMHFGRALLAGKLAENGFQTVEIFKDNSSPSEQTRPIDLNDYLSKVPGTTYAQLTGLKGREVAILYYGDRKKRPLPPAKWKRAQPLQSRFFVDGDRCLLLPGGVYGDANLAFSGYMGTRGLAWSLPADYQPEE